MALSAKETARELGTDARTFRKFMRSITPKDDQPGQGNRYAIEEKDLKKLRKKFDEWSAPKIAAADANGDGVVDSKKATKKKSKGIEAEGIDDDLDLIEDLDLEPSDDDLEELDLLED